MQINVKCVYTLFFSSISTTSIRADWPPTSDNAAPKIGFGSYGSLNKLTGNRGQLLNYLIIFITHTENNELLNGLTHFLNRMERCQAQYSLQHDSNRCA